MSRLRTVGTEAGMTLVEVLVAVTILSIAVVTIVSGLASTAASSDIHRKQATADTVARSYAEMLVQYVRGDGRLLDPTAHYAPCTASYTIPAAWGYTVPPNYSVSDTVTYWQGGSTFSPSCPAIGDLGAQQIKVTAQSNDGRSVDSFSVIVRQP